MVTVFVVVLGKASATVTLGNTVILSLLTTVLLVTTGAVMLGATTIGFKVVGCTAVEFALLPAVFVVVFVVVVVVVELGGTKVSFLTGCPGVCVLGVMLPNPVPALAASTIPVINPARASKPRRPMRIGLQQVFSSAAAAWTGAGGAAYTFCLE